VVLQYRPAAAAKKVVANRRPAPVRVAAAR
jgi:hypothetical protein